MRCFSEADSGWKGWQQPQLQSPPHAYSTFMRLLSNTTCFNDSESYKECLHGFALKHVNTDFKTQLNKATFQYVSSSLSQPLPSIRLYCHGNSEKKLDSLTFCYHVSTLHVQYIKGDDSWVGELYKCSTRVQKACGYLCYLVSNTTQQGNVLYTLPAGTQWTAHSPAYTKHTV